MKLLTGILVPSSGRISVLGFDPSRDRIRLAARVGVVFGQRSQLWWDLPLRESFELLRHVYRVPPTQHRTDLARFTELLDLGPFLGTPVRQLSLGQRMRGDLAAALLHRPELVYLDEPTIGLDVVAKAAIREFLTVENRERGLTVLLTSHDLADIERLCHRVLVIDRGHMVHDGPLTDLVDRLGDGRTLVVTLASVSPAIDLPGVRVLEVDGPRQRLAVDRNPAELVAAVMAVADVVDLRLEEPSVEQVVSRLYRRR
ncbi:MAG: ATP-binding cassette domain-containing protein [Ilumatobacteraceae bacterium]